MVLSTVNCCATSITVHLQDSLLCKNESLYSLSIKIPIVCSPSAPSNYYPTFSLYDFTTQVDHLSGIIQCLSFCKPAYLT